MHGIIPADAQGDIFPAARSCREISITPESGTGLPIAARSCQSEESPWFQKLCDDLWPDKPSAALFYLMDSKVPERTCRAYAAGDREPPAGFLRTLIRGSQGERVLDWITRGCKQPWDKERRIARIRSAGIVETEQRVQHELALEQIPG